MKLQFFKILMVVAVLAHLGSCSTTSPRRPRPHVDSVPEFARWLVASANWGVLSTLSKKGGEPFGYVASYSDVGNAGVPYFYLSTLDPAGTNAASDTRSSLTISEVELGNCTDPQSPTCGKITLSGNLVRLNPSSDEAEVAEAVLFSEHPLFTRFPKMNGTFSVYKLEIGQIFLVNKSAPPRNVTVGEYSAVPVPV